jgi:hypothetical protein
LSGQRPEGAPSERVRWSPPGHSNALDQTERGQKEGRKTTTIGGLVQTGKRRQEGNGQKRKDGTSWQSNGKTMEARERAGSTKTEEGRDRQKTKTIENGECEAKNEDSPRADIESSLETVRADIAAYMASRGVGFPFQ